MKILFINTFHFPGGGDRTYLFNLASLLESKGHSVAFFAMRHSKNLKNQWENYFIEEIDFKMLHQDKSLKSIIKVISRSIYSIESKKKINYLIQKFKPDIAHIHTIHNHISLSVLDTLKSNNVPIIWTLHNYAAMCPQSLFLRNGNICEECKGNKFYSALINKCIKNSYPASFIASISAYITTFLNLYDKVDLFLCPSQFLANKLIEYGFNTKKIYVLRNFVDIEFKGSINYGGNYGLYAGRLSYEKGLFTLLKAVKSVPYIPFKVVGDGELKNDLIKYCKSENICNVEFIDFQKRENLFEIYNKSKFTILPSDCFENGPLAILESFAMGKPVIGSDIGGIPEIIDNGINGYLFTNKDYKELAEKTKLLYDDRIAIEMGKKARIKVELEYEKEVHYKKLISVYNRFLK